MGQGASSVVAGKTTNLVRWLAITIGSSPYPGYVERNTGRSDDCHWDVIKADWHGNEWYGPKHALCGKGRKVTFEKTNRSKKLSYSGAKVYKEQDIWFKPDYLQASKKVDVDWSEYLPAVDSPNLPFLLQQEQGSENQKDSPLYHTLHSLITVAEGQYNIKFLQQKASDSKKFSRKETTSCGMKNCGKDHVSQGGTSDDCKDENLRRMESYRTKEDLDAWILVDFLDHVTEHQKGFKGREDFRSFSSGLSNMNDAEVCKKSDAEEGVKKLLDSEDFSGLVHAGGKKYGDANQMMGFVRSNGPIFVGVVSGILDETKNKCDVSSPDQPCTVLEETCAQVARPAKNEERLNQAIDRTAVIVGYTKEEAGKSYWLVRSADRKGLWRIPKGANCGRMEQFGGWTLTHGWNEDFYCEKTGGGLHQKCRWVMQRRPEVIMYRSWYKKDAAK